MQLGESCFCVVNYLLLKLQLGSCLPYSPSEVVSPTFCRLLNEQALITRPLLGDSYAHVGIDLIL